MKGKVTMKLRNIDYITIYMCSLAAALCYVGSNWSAPCFVVSSSIGLIDSIRNKTLSAALINGIFLTLNIAMTIKNLTNWHLHNSFQGAAAKCRRSFCSQFLTVITAKIYERIVNIPTIPIGLVGLRFRPSSPRFLPSSTSRIDVFSVEVQMSCIDAQKSCTCRSCVGTNFGAASMELQMSCVFPCFSSAATSKSTKIAHFCANELQNGPNDANMLFIFIFPLSL